MKIHEFQAKELFRRYDIPVPKGSVAFSSGEAAKIAGELGQFPVVVKAQIHAGGRGKGGGVELAQSIEDAKQLAGGVVSAAKKTGIDVPVVVRMEGTNVDEGRRILAESGLNLITAADMKDAAGKVAKFVALK